MARSQARVLVTIWTNESWQQTSSAAQRLYLLLLSQAKLTLAGCLDLMPDRWASLAPDTSSEDVITALHELVERRFVAVDWETGEVVVRTFVEHDLGAGTTNRNLIKGMWSAWQAILSPKLRRVVVENVPDDLWEKIEQDAPKEAQRFRRSEASEPQFEPQLEPPFEPASEPQSEPPFEDPTEDPSNHLNPATCLPLPVTSTAATSDERPETEPDTLIDEAAFLMGLEEARRRGPDIAKPDKYARSRRADLRRQWEPAWRKALESNPKLTAVELVEGLKPKPQRRPEPTDSTAAAAARRYELAEARRRGEVCATCNGTFLVESDGGFRQCDACVRAAS